MSGTINEHVKWDSSRNLRYETMLRKINKSNATSLAQESLYESRVQSSTFKSNNGTLNTQSFYPAMGSNSTSNNFEAGEKIQLPSVSQTSGSVISGRTNSNLGSSIRYKKNTSKCVQQPHLQGLNHNELSTAEVANVPSAVPSESNYAVSETTVFKQPFPPRGSGLDEKTRLKRRINLMLQLCHEDKTYLRFISRWIESSMHVYSTQIALPVSYKSVLETINQTFMETYGSEVLKGVGFSVPSSLRSESMLSFAPGAEVLNGMGCSAPLSLRSESVISHNPGMHEISRTMHGGGKTLTGRTVENSQELVALHNMNRSTSSTSLMNSNDSQMTLKIDKLPIRLNPPGFTQPRATNKMALPKPTPRPQGVRAANKVGPAKPKLNASVDKRVRAKKVDTTLLQKKCKEALQESITPDAPPERVKGVTRTGRVVRSPQMFWKGNDTTREHINYSKEKESFKETPSIDALNKKKVDLNESMTLRSNRVLERKKTPPIKNINSKNTPLGDVNNSRETMKTARKPIQKNKCETITEDKENSTSKRGRPRKKPNKRDQTKEDFSLDKGSKAAKKDKMSKKEPIEKKVRKRKNEDKQEIAPDSSVLKKKKIDESLQHSSEDDLDFDDDLFEVGKYKKPTKTAPRNFSPNSGMMSIKMDAVASFCKETPPCKALGQFMSTSGISAASASKDLHATKPDQVVKRVGKVLKRKVNKPVTKQTGVKPTTSKVILSNLPLTATLISAEFGNNIESNSDDSDFENEDDDSDLQ